MPESSPLFRYAVAMVSRSVIAFSVIGLAAAAGLFVLGQTRGVDEPDPGPLPALKVVNAFPKLTFDLPLWFGHDGTGSGWLYVCEQDGMAWRFKKDADTKEAFLDLTGVIPVRRQRHNEEGLLALAFHPDFKKNRYFYVCYSQLKSSADKPRRGVISRFTADKDGKPTDLKTEKTILEVQQPYGNHKGCTLLFGKDGYLYASFGDGGAANDPHGAGQNLNTLLAKVLRIDIDKEDEGKAYAVPKDNPFVGRTDAKPEIWAYGLRNIWRMSFDAETGLLWGGDVGQNLYEEIDIIEKGGNYGWNTREGMHAFQRGEKTDDMIDPVVEYPRSAGVSVTGGHVYRGKKIKDLKGVYIYGDYQSGRIWGIDYDVKEKKVKGHELLVHARSLGISSFGEDEDGEIYVCAHFKGTISRLELDK